ncbi:antibiotic biosynthesis monooxygenase [Nocardioides sp. W7]|uniref:putative quinol monooxygenase n=1 Tax=Nocardioides sp. W7 TaxID=2931390 RepID=UPI001FD11059|nr:antibiotic biosynthesis monooxygenase [Nocardioides sp. W7]
MPLRILHRLTLPATATASATATGRLAAEAVAARSLPGCREAEAYRSLSSPDQVAVVQLWEDEDAHDAYAAAVADGAVASLPAELASRDEAGTEAYAHEYAAPVEGVWTAASQSAGRRIVWPARGAVRIVIQSCFADPDAEAPGLLANEAETRREPGCLEFAWMRGVEDPRHILLLELWESQRIYDQHWLLRRRSGSGGPARVRAERTFGSNGAEFYRQQEFRLLYDRWLPRAEDAWSTTVDWPA